MVYSWRRLVLVRFHACRVYRKTGKATLLFQETDCGTFSAPPRLRKRIFIPCLWDGSAEECTIIYLMTSTKTAEGWMARIRKAQTTHWTMATRMPIGMTHLIGKRNLVGMMCMVVTWKRPTSLSSGIE